MAAGADHIDDMDVLRHGAMGTLFYGIRAPSTLGSFLRSFTWGNVSGRQSNTGRCSCPLWRVAAPLLPGKDVLAFIDIDSDAAAGLRARQGGERRSGIRKSQGKSLLVRGLNVLAAVVSPPLGRAGDRRDPAPSGSANSARGTASPGRRGTHRHPPRQAAPGEIVVPDESRPTTPPR